jgi:hypothetical protein
MVGALARAPPRRSANLCGELAAGRRWVQVKAVDAKILSGSMRRASSKPSQAAWVIDIAGFTVDNKDTSYAAGFRRRLRRRDNLGWLLSLEYE